jgi:stage V sporulation protein R
MLYLYHRFESKPLVQEYIANTMLGIEFLWGAPVSLETSECERQSSGGKRTGISENRGAKDITWKRVLYTMNNKKLSRKEL